MKVPYTKAGKSGNVVWQRNRHCQISYPYCIQANSRTIDKLHIRASFGSVSTRWRTLTEEQRVSWCGAGKKRKTRRRLGLCWPLPGFNYFVKINVALAYRGQAQTDLPTEDSPRPGTSVPNLSLTLLPQAHQPSTESPHPAPESTGHAPPSSG
jgi:hypothetical protein